MDNLRIAITSCILLMILLHGKAADTPLERLIDSRQVKDNAELVELFTRVDMTDRLFFLDDELRYYEAFELDDDVYQSVFSDNKTDVKFKFNFNDQDVVLLLTQNEIFTSNSKIKTSDGIEREASDARFYRGVIDGVSGSMASVSFFKNEIRLLCSDPISGNFRINLSSDGLYVGAFDKNILNPPVFDCNVDEYTHVPNENRSNFIYDDPQLRSSCQSVEIYFECAYAFYLEMGSIGAVEQQVAALFNEVQTIFFNEDIPLFISDIFVRTEQYVYHDVDIIEHVLFAFEGSLQNNYNGRLAHLLTTRNLGGGIADGIGGLCEDYNPGPSNDPSFKGPYAVSGGITGVSGSVHPYPTYSWSVMVIAHELGHNFGSHHTHWCGWPGGAIDNCADTEGSCSPGPNPPGSGGTIMSYCHQTGNPGISFSAGFGPLPGDAIRDGFGECSQLNTCNTWVDYNWNGSENGTYDRPFDTLLEGVNAVDNGGVIYIKSSSDDETLTIDVSKSFLIRTWDGASVIGQ